MKRLVPILLVLSACAPKSPEPAAPPPNAETAVTSDNPGRPLAAAAPPRVDNVAIRYTDSLRYDVEKAKSAQQKANQAIANEQNTAQQLSDQIP